MKITTFAAIYIGSYEVSMKIFEISPNRRIRQIDHLRSRLELGKDAYNKGVIGYELVEDLCQVLKEFHSIEKVRTEKIFAYTVAWIVRRKPLQFKDYTDAEKDIYVNERFAAYLMLNECLLCGEKKLVSGEGRIKLDEYIKLLLYYFKYRECNPQVIELAIESFKMGMLVLKE